MITIIACDAPQVIDLPGALERPEGIVSDGDDKLYVTDFGNGRLVRVHADDTVEVMASTSSLRSWIASTSTAVRSRTESQQPFPIVGVSLKALLHK